MLIIFVDDLLLFSSLLLFLGNICTFFLLFYLPSAPPPLSSSYESSWIKSLHYKTIRSEASGNAAGIRRSPPTAAARDGEGEEKACLAGWWWGGRCTGQQQRTEDHKSASMTHRRGTKMRSFLKIPARLCQSIECGSPASDGNVANSPPWQICSQSLSRSSTDNEGH